MREVTKRQRLPRLASTKLKCPKSNILSNQICKLASASAIFCNSYNASSQELSLRIQNLVNLSILLLLPKRSALLSYRLSSPVLSFSSSLICYWLFQAFPKFSYSPSVSHVVSRRFCTFSPYLGSSSIALSFANLFFRLQKAHLACGF